MTAPDRVNTHYRDRHPPASPLLHKLKQRREQFRAWQPDCRDGGLDGMLIGLVVMIALGGAAVAIWGGP